MSKVHLIAAHGPMDFLDGQEQRTLCHEVVANAKPIFRLDLATGHMESRSTIVFCTTCLQLALTPVDKRTWVYGILPAEEAHRRNLADRMEDF